MTPAEVRALTAPEYLAFLRVADEEDRELRRQAKQRGKRR